MVLFSKIVSIAIQGKYEEDMYEDIHRYSLQFLTLVQDYSDDLQINMIETKYNFFSLLNLSETMKSLSPVREVWEGGIIGENITPIIKKKVAKNNKQWRKALLSNVIIDMEIAHSFDRREKVNRTNFRTYSTDSEILENLKSKIPVSGFFTQILYLLRRNLQQEVMIIFIR